MSPTSYQTALSRVVMGGSVAGGGGCQMGLGRGVLGTSMHGAPVQAGMGERRCKPAGFGS